MTLRALAAALAVLLFALSLVVAVGTGVWWPAMLFVGAGSLGLGIAGFAGGVSALVMFGRYLHSDRADGRNLAVGDSEWVKLAGTVRADETVETALDVPAVAHDVRIRTKETFSGTSRPGAFAGTLVTERTGVPFTLQGGEPIDVDPGDDPRVVGEGSGTLFGPDATPPQSLLEFLAARGESFDANVFEGTLFRHSLHVDERTVTPGDSVRLFGKVVVTTDGSRRSLRPAPGCFGGLVLTTESWTALRTHLARRIALGFGLSPLYAAFGGAVLWSLVPT